MENIRLTYKQKRKRKFLSELNADMTSHLFMKNLEYSSKQYDRVFKISNLKICSLQFLESKY